MAKQVQPILIKLGLEGYEELAKLKSAFRGLDTTVKQSDAGLNKAREALLEYGRTAQQSEALMEGMVSAFKGLKAQADVTGPTFRQLDADIKRLKADMYGASEAVDKEREALVRNANAVKTNTLVVGRYVGELKKLRQGVRENSDAAKQFDKDIAQLTERLRKMQDVQLKDVIVGSVKGAQGAIGGLQGTVQGAIAMFRRLGEQSKTALGQVARTAEGIAAIGVGGAVAGVGAGAVGGIGSALQGTLGYLTSTKAALGSAGFGLGPKLSAIIPDSAIANLTEAASNVAALQAKVASLDAAMDGITQAFTAFGPTASAGAIAASVGIAAVYDQLRKKADETRKELETTFKSVNDEVAQLIQNTARLGDQLRSLSVSKLNELLGAARQRFAFAPAGSPLSRAMASQIAGLESVQAKELADQAVVLEEYRARVRGSSTSLQDLGQRLSFVQERLKTLDTSTREGAAEFASLSSEALQLTNRLQALGDGYRHVSTMATQAATAQQNAANAAMRNNYFNRAAVRQQEEAIRELGQRVRAAVEGTPLALPAAGQTSAPGTGQAMSGGARRLRGQVEYTFQDPINVGGGRQVPNYLRDPRYAQLRNLQTTAATGVSPAVGFSGRDPSIQRSIPAYKEAQQELAKVLLSSNNTIQSLEKQRNAWNALRSAIDPASSTFANATKRVQELDNRLDSLSAKQQKVQKRRLGAQGLTQIAGAAISGGIFGGPEGFLGGVAGGALGGVGGAFAGAAIGAQVAGLRQAAGAAAEYAAAINQQRRALSGVVEDSAAYQQSLAFIDQTSRALAIPQEQVTRNFTRLSASVLGAGGDVAAAQEAFTGIAAGIRGTGGSLADLDAALLATAQVFSKGKVSAEELRGQIGERLPGAFTLFAESIGKTPAELDKLLEQGRVTLDDFMKFVRTLDTEYGRQALAMAASTEAAGDRLKVAFGRMQEDVGKALLPIGAQFQSMFAKALDAMTPFLATALPMLGNAALEVAKNLDVLVATLGALATAALVNAAVNTTKLVAAFASLTQAVLRARDAILASNAALLLNPWVALAAGVTAATVGLVRYYRAQKEVNDLITYGSGSTKELNDKKYELTKRLEEETALLDAAIKRYGESGRVVDALRRRVKDFEDQLNKVTGTHTVRLKLEREGYRFDEDGNVQSFQVEGVGSFNISGRGSKGQLVKGSSRSAFGAGDQKKQEEAAKSLLNAIDQREEAIARARIQLEEQAAQIRKQALQQAKQLEESFATQRLTREREIAAARRQLAATQADVGFETAAFNAMAVGADVELVRIQQRADQFRRQQEEARITLEQRIADENTQRAKGIEDLKVKTAEAINEANTRYVKAIGEAQQQYARAVAKIIEEGTGRSGKRLEAAGRIVAALIDRATKGQAFLAASGKSVRSLGGGQYEVGGELYANDAEFRGQALRAAGSPEDVKKVAAAAYDYVMADYELMEAQRAMAALPTAAASASASIASISVNTADLTKRLQTANAQLANLGDELQAVSGDEQTQAVFAQFAKDALSIAQGSFQVREGLAKQQARQEPTLAAREALGLSQQGAEQYLDSLIRAEEALARLTVLYEEHKKSLPEDQVGRLTEKYEMATKAVAATAAATQDLIRANEKASASFTVRTAIADTKLRLEELTDTGNIVVTSANNIGDAFGEAFNKLITGAGSAKQVLADFFQSVANSFFKMAQEIISQLMVMITLQAVGKIFGLAGSAAGASGPTSFGADNPVGDYAFGAAGPIPAEASFPVFARGGAFTPQGHLERYAKGGIVNQATMFRFAKGGSFAPGILGEAGPEAILPLQRTPSGDLGVRAVPYMRGQDKTPLQVPFRRHDEDFTTGSTEGTIRFESTVINSQEFVTRDEAERIGQAAASRGAQIAQRRMKNNPQVRRSLGIA